MKNEKNISNSEINELVKKIQNEILEGKQRAEIAIENEKTITYWKIGKHINGHLPEHAGRAEYGEELFKRLSEKLGIKKSILYQTVQFFKEYPNIFHARGKLKWTHYRILLSVKSEEKRKDLDYVYTLAEYNKSDRNKLLELLQFIDAET